MRKRRINITQIVNQSGSQYTVHSNVKAPSIGEMLSFVYPDMTLEVIVVDSDTFSACGDCAIRRHDAGCPKRNGVLLCSITGTWGVTFKNPTDVMEEL